MVGSSNVKTVKEQTFHKRSTNVPMSYRNETKKRLSSFPNVSYRRRSFLFGPGEQILDTIDQSFLNKRNLATIPKRFGFLSKTRNVCHFVFDIISRRSAAERSNAKQYCITKRLRTKRAVQEECFRDITSAICSRSPSGLHVVAYF